MQDHQIRAAITSVSLCHYFQSKAITLAQVSFKTYLVSDYSSLVGFHVSHFRSLVTSEYVNENLSHVSLYHDELCVWDCRLLGLKDIFLDHHVYVLICP